MCMLGKHRSRAPGLNAWLAYGAVQGVTWLLALGPIGREGWSPALNG